MNRKSLRYTESRALEVGKTYTLNNGVSIKLTSIWTDKYGDSVSYRCADGKAGDTPPNSLYHSIVWP
jgi:hypothetical protein